MHVIIFFIWLYKLSQSWPWRFLWCQMKLQVPPGAIIWSLDHPNIPWSNFGLIMQTQWNLTHRISCDSKWGCGVPNRNATIIRMFHHASSLDHLITLACPQKILIQSCSETWSTRFQVTLFFFFKKKNYYKWKVKLRKI